MQQTLLVCIFKAKKDLHCYDKVFQKYPRPALRFASKYAMMPMKKGTKDIIFIYILMVHLKFVCYKGIKTGKKL